MKKIISLLMCMVLFASLSMQVVNAHVWEGDVRRDGWTRFHVYGSQDCTSYLNFDDTVSYSGNTSFNLDSYGKRTSGADDIINFTKPLTAGKSYKAGFYLKTTKDSTDFWGAGAAMQVVFSDTASLSARGNETNMGFINNTANYTYTTVTTEDGETWFKFETVGTFTPAESKAYALALRFEKNAWQELWVDDISVFEVGGDGTNYMTNPGFEETSRIEGWTRFHVYGSQDCTSYLNFDTNVSYSGEASFNLDLYGKRTSGADDIINFTKPLTAGKSYKAGFYLKTTNDSTDFWGAGAAMQVVFSDTASLSTRGTETNMGMINNTANYTYTTVTTEDGETWFKFETINSFTPTESKAYALALRFEKNAWHELWVDDVSVFEVGGDGTNYMTNPGFEPISNVPVVETTEITNLIATSEAATDEAQALVTLSWKNPVNSRISGYTLKIDDLDVSNYIDVEGFLDAKFLPVSSAASEEYCYMSLRTDVEDEHCYTVGVVMGNDSDTDSVTIKGDRTSAANRTSLGAVNLGGWSYGRVSTGSLPNIAFALTDEASVGDKAFNIKSNSAATAGVGGELKQAVVVDKTKSYTLTFDVKGDKNLSIGASLGGAESSLLTLNSNSEEWKTESVTIDLSSIDGYSELEDEYADLTVRFYVSGYADGISIDNVSLKAEGSNENLIKNGGFEYEIKTASANGNTISWTKPEGAAWDAVNIYKKQANGTYEKVVTVSADSYTFVNQAAGEYKIVPVTGTVELSAGVTVTVEETVITELVIGTVTYNMVDAEGNVTEADVKNIKTGFLQASIPVLNGSNEDVNFTAYLALYKDGVFNKIAKTTVPFDKNSQVAVPVETVINVPALDDGVYTLKLFMWDENISPISDDVYSLEE